jgi:hypothetical protein
VCVFRDGASPLTKATFMSELIAITTYFNPCRYQTRRQNYDLFMASLRKTGVTCLTVECAFPGQAFELPRSAGVIQMRAETLLWQKERLLNLAASWLPKSCRYVAWLDCDIVFENKNWGRDLVQVLKQVPATHPNHNPSLPYPKYVPPYGLHPD